MSSAEAILAVQQCVEEWDLPFERSCTRGRVPNTVVATFSKPTNKQPVPGAVVTIYFQLKLVNNKQRGRNAKSKSFVVESYRLENELHAYKLEDGMPTADRLNAILSTKARMKGLFDLRTPADMTRLLDPKEQEEELDIVFKEESVKSQVPVDKESILDLEQYLIQLFRDADKSGDGLLDHQEFLELLTDSKLGLAEDDAHLILASADGDKDGHVNYQEFVPVAMELIQSVQAREQTREEADGEYKAREQQAMKAAAEYFESGPEREQMDDLISKLESLLDANAKPPQSKRVARATYTRCLRDRKLGLTKHEVNMLMTMSTYDGDYVVYGNIGGLIEQTRLLSIKEFVMEKLAGQNRVETEILKVFRDAEKRQAKSTQRGYLSVKSLRDALSTLQKPRLTKLQIVSLVSEAPMTNQRVDYAAFAPIAARLVEGMFDPASLEQKSLLMQRAEVSPVEMMNGMDKQALEDQLMHLFMKHDEDHNGTLDATEFRACLKATSLGLDDGNIEALVLTADNNQDAQIDIDEFMGIAYSTLIYLAREKTLQSMMT